MLLAKVSRPTADPFAEIRRLQSEMNRMFEQSAAPAPDAYPAVNVWLGKDSVAVTTELPGLTADDVDLTAHEDTLTIRGERRPSENTNDVTWHRQERAYGTFSRTIALPFRVDPAKIKAHFHEGVLEVELPRPEADRPRKIQIKAN
jgi:HSP20 family protein